MVHPMSTSSSRRQRARDGCARAHRHERPLRCGAFWNAAKDAGIRPIYGAEIQTLDFGHLVLIARDRIGWRSLCRTISAAQLAGEKTKPRATLALVAENAEGLFALTGCAYGCRSACDARRRRRRGTRGALTARRDLRRALLR
jgi:error-prone DNA polymerase